MRFSVDTIGLCLPFASLGSLSALRFEAYERVWDARCAEKHGRQHARGVGGR